MAKSLRSKRKRKIRAEKRAANAKKELIKLKEVVAKLHGQAASNSNITKDAIESSFPDVQVATECPMLLDDASSVATVSKKQRMQINNQWMNQKKIKAIKSKIKRHNSKKGRRSKSAGLSSRKVKKSIKGKK